MKGLALWGTLLLANIVAASGIAYTKHANVILFRKIQEQRNLYQQLQTDWGRLLLEHGVLSAPTRIEKFATENLQMRRPDLGDIYVLHP